MPQRPQRAQRTEDRRIEGEKTEDRRQRTEDRRLEGEKTEDRRQRTEDRREVDKKKQKKEGNFSTISLTPAKIFLTGKMRLFSTWKDE